MNKKIRYSLGNISNIIDSKKKVRVRKTNPNISCIKLIYIQLYFFILNNIYQNKVDNSEI